MCNRHQPSPDSEPGVSHFGAKFWTTLALDVVPLAILDVCNDARRIDETGLPDTHTSTSRRP